MNNIPERWRALVEFAIREGWQVRCSANGRITLTKPGYAAIYTAAAPRNRGNGHG